MVMALDLRLEFDSRPLPRLVLGCVIVFERANQLSISVTKPPRPTLPPSLSGMGNECDDALLL